MKIARQTENAFKKRGSTEGVTAKEIKNFVADIDTDQDGVLSVSEAAKSAVHIDDIDTINAALRQGDPNSEAKVLTFLGEETKVSTGLTGPSENIPDKKWNLCSKPITQA